MKRLLASCFLALASAIPAAAEDGATAHASLIAACTREAAARGYAGRELVDAVAKCVEAKREDPEIDPAILAAMSSC